MNLDNLNKWLMLVANIGVLAGIFFLVLEIRQNKGGKPARFSPVCYGRLTLGIRALINFEDLYRGIKGSGFLKFHHTNQTL